VALGINAVTRALESNSARAVVVCGAPDRPAVLVAHLFAGAAARQVPALDLPALDGLQLASQLRMRTLGAFAILADASEASFVALAEQVARHAPRADSLPWIPLYLGESERLDAQPIGKAVKDAGRGHRRCCAAPGAAPRCGQAQFGRGANEACAFEARSGSRFSCRNDAKQHGDVRSRFDSIADTTGT
jgi:hypothetical protein